MQSELGFKPHSLIEMRSVAGFRSFHVEEVDSTMNLALKLAQTLPQIDFVVTATKQTKGRGRHGRPWYSPPGNLYATFAVRRALAPGTCYLLAACAASDSMASYDIKIKHPNDLYLNGKKLGGILVELHSNLTLVGIGVNLGSHPVHATSVQLSSRMLLEVLSKKLNFYFGKQV